MTASDDTTPDPTPDPSTIDPGSLKDAHGRTGRLLKAAGLPFEPEEFEDEGEPGDDDSSSSSSEEE